VVGKYKKVLNTKKQERRLGQIKKKFGELEDMKEK
jgi:hypothetical protein